MSKKEKKPRAAALRFSFCCCRLDTVPYRYPKNTQCGLQEMKLVRDREATLEDWEEHLLVLCRLAGQLLCAPGADPAPPTSKSA